VRFTNIAEESQKGVYVLAHGVWLVVLKKDEFELIRCTAEEPCVLHEADLGSFAYSFNMSVEFVILYYVSGESSVRCVHRNSTKDLNKIEYMSEVFQVVGADNIVETE